MRPECQKVLDGLILSCTVLYSLAQSSKVLYSLDSDPTGLGNLGLFETNIIGRSYGNWCHQVSTGLAKSQQDFL